MQRRAIALNHMITNLEMMQSETSIWNMMNLAEEKTASEISGHAAEHGFGIDEKGIQHLWYRRNKPEDLFMLTSMATLQKEEVDTPQNAA